MTLLQKVKQLPQTPGVYLFKSSDGSIVYVGKATRLGDRVRSYFQASFRGKRQPRFSMDDIADIEVRRTGSEIDALILEAYLIKTCKPRYNVAMKDDKQYFYVGFTKEPFSKIVIVHQLQTTRYKLLTKHIGPFVSGRALTSALRTLRKIFPYCTCKRAHVSRQTCLNYHLGLDPGFCCERRPALQREKKMYRENISRTLHILRGKARAVCAAVKKEMEAAADSKQFERAAGLREQLGALKNILAHRRVTHQGEEQGTSEVSSSLVAGILRIEGYDISNVQGHFAVGSMVVFERDSHQRLAPKKSDYRRFKIRTVQGANDPAMIEEVVTRRLLHPEWPLPQVMLIDGGLTQRNAALAALARFTLATPPAIWSLAKQHEELYTAKGKVLLDHVPASDARLLKLLRDEAHRFAIGYYRKVHKQACFSLGSK